MTGKQERKRQVILDEVLIRQYSTVLCEAYDGLCELNLSKESYHTIFYTDDKLLLPADGSLDFEAFAERMIHPEDHKQFLSVFQLDCLKHFCKYQKNDETRHIEYRKRNKDGEYRWTKAVLFPVTESEDKIVLCCTMDMDAKKQFELLQKVNEELFSVFTDIYMNIAEVDLDSNSAVVIKCASNQELIGRVFEWEQLMEEFCKRKIHEDDKKAVYENFSRERLEALCAHRRADYSIDIRYEAEKNHYQWAELSAVNLSQHRLNKRILISTRNIDEHHMLKSIVERYVYKNCDYFIHIDARKNSYMMFNGSDSGTPLPPKSSEDYTREMIRYTKAFVALEDRERVLKEMQIDRILEVLDNQGEHTFCCGVLDPHLGYTRKRLQFLYYDQANKMVLLTRTDITKGYLEERRQNERLKSALKRAQTDSLTGLYNQQTISSLVSESLSQSDGSLNAFIFIDLDNFKMVNDTLGHPKGDQLLKYVADVFRKKIRTSDILGRVGGDEFVVYLPGIASPCEAAQCAGRLCDAIACIPDCQIRQLDVSCSVGISIAPKDGRDYDTLFQKADQALYLSKGKGKNCISFCEDCQS